MRNGFTGFDYHPPGNGIVTADEICNGEHVWGDE